MPIQTVRDKLKIQINLQAKIFLNLIKCQKAMKTESYNISLSFNQILDVVRQLPKNQKIKLAKELEKEAIDTKLTNLLTSFRTEELSLGIIDKEVELVRQELYAKSKKD